jgi:hypothetical protein
VIDMKKMISMSLMILMLFAFGSVLYQAEAQTPTPTPLACTDCGNFFCAYDGKNCWIDGYVCIDEALLDDIVFWYAVDHQQGGWTGNVELTETVPCEEGCVAYAISGYIGPLPCGTEWEWRVTLGWDVNEGIICDSGTWGRINCDLL